MLERRWYARVQEAQAHYQQALEHQERLLQELDQALAEEGSFAAAKTHRAAVLALNELVRCQRVLVNLILRKEVPHDEDEKLLI